MYLSVMFCSRNPNSQPSCWHLASRFTPLPWNNQWREYAKPPLAKKKNVVASDPAAKNHIADRVHLRPNSSEERLYWDDARKSKNPRWSKYRKWVGVQSGSIPSGLRLNLGCFLVFVLDVFVFRGRRSTLWTLKCRFRGRCRTFVAGAGLCGPWSADFVAGAGLCGPWSADFVAGTVLCGPWSADFVAGARYLDR